jgi:hypothetical protein
MQDVSHISAEHHIRGAKIFAQFKIADRILVFPTEFRAHDCGVLGQKIPGFAGIAVGSFGILPETLVHKGSNTFMDRHVLLGKIIIFFVVVVEIPKLSGKYRNPYGCGSVLHDQIKLAELIGHPFGYSKIIL